MESIARILGGDNMLKRLKNKATLIGIASAVLMILSASGHVVDNEKVMAIINSVCFIGVALGILNDPTTDGIDNVFITDKDKGEL